MLQCGLVRSNFALAIHIHLCSPRLAPACKTAAGLASKNGSVQAGNSAPMSRQAPNLGTKNKTAMGRVLMNAQAAAKQTAAPQTPPLPDGKPEALGLSPVRLQLISDALKREIDKGTIPGATILVARRGRVGWFDALGRQSPAASAPMTRDSIFRIFSMTKPIVSIAVMQ